MGMEDRRRRRGKEGISTPGTVCGYRFMKNTIYRRASPTFHQTFNKWSIY
jgi:hypothetical protein